MSEMQMNEEEKALGAFLSAMHDCKLDGGRMREAMLKTLGLTDRELIPEGVLTAIRVAGLTLLKNQNGYELRNLGKVEAQSDDLTVARQAKEIYSLADRVKELEERIHDAKLHMICIGGPLNDNKLQFNKEQRQVFHNIMQELGD